jgi:hypothetical protein
MFLRHRTTKKKLRKIRKDRERRQTERGEKRGDIVILARSLARWAVLELRSGGREYWYPNRYCQMYKPATA